MSRWKLSVGWRTVCCVHTHSAFARQANVRGVSKDPSPKISTRGSMCCLCRRKLRPANLGRRFPPCSPNANALLGVMGRSPPPRAFVKPGRRRVRRRNCPLEQTCRWRVRWGRRSLTANLHPPTAARVHRDGRDAALVEPWMHHVHMLSTGIQVADTLPHAIWPSAMQSVRHFRLQLTDCAYDMQPES
jgi:hypothetical protein